MSAVPVDRLAGLLGRWSAGEGSLRAQLARRLGQLIEEGQLPGGCRLPPERALATALAVSRSTVVGAYDVLRESGAIERRQGSGTTVATSGRQATTGNELANPMIRNLLDGGHQMIRMVSAGPMDLTAEITDAYRDVVHDLQRGSAAGDFGYHPAGHPVLRAAIAAHYTRRGVPTGPEDVLVTTGAQQALYLIAGSLIGRSDVVVTESPTYPGALELFGSAGATVVQVPTGPYGVDVDGLRKALGRRPAALVYLMPTHHNPTGTVLPAVLRPAVVAAVEASGAVLVEDEVLADLSFSGSIPPSLASYRPDGDVISLGSLSKVAWGGLRVGWLRADARRVAYLSGRKAMIDLGSDVVTQLVAARLLPQLSALRDGRTSILRPRHDDLCDMLATRLPSWSFRRAEGGQTLWVRLPVDDAGGFVQEAIRHGVAVLPGRVCDPVAGLPYLRLPFLLSTDQLDLATRALAGAWVAHRRRRA